MTSSAVAVLVELPLAVPFETFIAVFDMHIQPLVMRQEGIISFKKGRRLEDPAGAPWAIILAVWQSIQFNDHFLTSQTAQHINDELQTMIRGPTVMTRYRLNVGPQLLDYIPYSSFRRFRVSAPLPLDKANARDAKHEAWLSNMKGLNVVSTWAELCSTNPGCNACYHDKCRSEKVVVLSLNGLSPESVRGRSVTLTTDAKLLVSFTIEWITSVSLDSYWGSSPQLSRKSLLVGKRLFWDTMLADNISNTLD
ncbi:hypothetical protein BKA63DRAFT_484840 [Paraphoma chrysanthemicola]|nr:hypothetical protein BKA63DRAFT_484840 [Paraphoma chrysanthemicola]